MKTLRLSEVFPEMAAVLRAQEHLLKSTWIRHSKAIETG